MESHLWEKTLATTELYKGKIVRLEKLEVELPNGKRALREVVRHNGGAGILAIDSGNRVILVRQFRVALGRITLEIPAGKVEPNEDPLVCVRRELEEETGLVADQMTHCLSFYPTVGYCSEMIHLYLATQLRTGRVHPDEDEFIEVVRMPLAEFIEQAADGQLQDGKTVIAALWAAKHLAGGK